MCIRDRYESGHVPGAVLVPLDTVPDRVEELSAMGPLVLILSLIHISEPTRPY